MDNSEAAQLLLDNLPEDEELALAMRMGARALQEEELPKWIPENISKWFYRGEWWWLINSGS